VKILALDLGTFTGFAYGEINSPVAHLVAGTLELATPKEITRMGKDRRSRTDDWRIGRFYKWLLKMGKLFHPDVVIWEDVRFSSYTFQTQLWASFRTTVWIAMHQIGEPLPYLECVDVQTLKIFATGHGGATKVMMATALYKQHPELKEKCLGDDAVDAIFLFKWAEKNLSRLKPNEPTS